MNAPTLDRPCRSWTSCSAAPVRSAYANALASAWNSAQALTAVSNTVAASKNRPADPSRTSCSASRIALCARARDATSHCSISFICAVAVASSPMPPHARRIPSSIARLGRSSWALLLEPAGRLGLDRILDHLFGDCLRIRSISAAGHHFRQPIQPGLVRR